MKQAVWVLGAGMVGTSCALELQRRGYAVTLLDRRGVAEETSFGNAGLLSYSNITPIADPELLTRLPQLILNRDADFKLHYPHLWSLLPWLLRFLLRCRRKVYLRDGDAMASLTLPSIDLHRQWIAEAGVQRLMNQGGALKLYRQPGTLRRDDLERELLDQCEVKYTMLDAAQVYELEPDLKRIFHGGMLIDDTVSIRDPQKLCQAYARLFEEAGGMLRRDEIRALQQRDDGWAIDTDRGTEAIGKVVVCLGAWTPQLLAPLGYRNPLAIERGYHRLFRAQPGCRLTRPIYDTDASYVMAPMESGLRVSTGSNLVHREVAPDPSQVERVTPRVREAFPVEDEIFTAPWMGRRPTVPDSLPLIGPAPGRQNLWLAFAHSHMGFTMGPMTAQLIANDIDGAPQPIVTDFFDPARYL